MATPAPSPDPTKAVDRLVNSLRLQVPSLDVTADRLDELGVFEDGWVSRHEWEEMQPFIAERQRHMKLENRFRTFQRELEEHLILDWLRNELPKESGSYGLLCDEIQALVRWDRTDELYEFVRDAVDIGSKKARQKYKRRVRGGLWRYIGTLLFALAQIIVVYAVFSLAESRFQTAALALLVLMLVTTIQARHANWLHSTGAFLGIDKQFKRVRRVLSTIGEPDYDTELLIEAQREAEQKLTREGIRYYIRDTAALICMLIAVWRLLNALSSVI